MLRYRALILVLSVGAGCCATAQADSLWRVWNDTTLADSVRLKAMQTMAWKTVFESPDSGIALAQRQLALARRAHLPKAEFEAFTTLAAGSSMKSDYRASLGYLEQCLATATAMNDRSRLANTHSNMSNVYKNLGDQPKALDQLQQSMRIDQELGNKAGLAGTFNNIGNIHTELGDLQKALENYEKSAALYTELGDRKGQAQALQNLGTTHAELGDRERAVEELERSLIIYRGMGRKLEQGMAHNNLGRNLGRSGRIREAFLHLDSAEAIFTAIGNQRSLARTFSFKGDLRILTGDPQGALRECRRGDAIALENGLLLQHKECSDCLMRAYAALGDYRHAFQAQQAYMTTGDSLDRINDSKEVTRLEVTRAFQERMIADSLTNVRVRYEREIAYTAQLGRERDRRNILLFSGLGVLLLAGALWNRLRFTRRSRAAIQKEKDRSEDLLLNILPAEVAEELKSNGRAAAREFAQATVLFSDFKGFTHLAEVLEAAELVAEIDHCFRGFDAIAERHGIEKIKTIGDAYMAVAGVPDPTSSRAVDIVLAALDMQSFIAERKAEREREGRPAFDMRVGLHTGPVVAGVVGVKKFQYDIWGDTVNTAARMESSGEIGQVNISATTYALVKDEPGLRFGARGRVEAKNKGSLEMYFVTRA